MFLGSASGAGTFGTGRSLVAPLWEFGAARSDSHISQKVPPSSLLPHLGSVWRAPGEHERQKRWFREPQWVGRNPFLVELWKYRYCLCSGLFRLSREVQPAATGLICVCLKMVGLAACLPKWGFSPRLFSGRTVGIRRTQSLVPCWGCPCVLTTSGSCCWFGFVFQSGGNIIFKQARKWKQLT